LDRRCGPRDPDLQFRIEIEGPGGFHRKAGDRPVRNAEIIDLAARKALDIDQDHALVREDDEIADDLEGETDALALDQYAGKPLRELAGIDLAAMAEKTVQKSHFSPPII